MFLVTVLLLSYPLLGAHTAAALWVARFLGLRIKEASFGLGPVVWRRTDQAGGTLRVGLLPGGFVRVQGWTRDPEDLTSFVEVYGERGLGKRALAALAGPLAILALGWLAAVAHAWLAPPDQLVQPLTVHSVSSGSPAQRAGLAPGDQLLRLGQSSTTNLEQLLAAAANCGRCEIELRRAGQLLRLPVEPVLVPNGSVYVLGVALERRRQPADLGTALAQGSRRITGLVELQLRDLASMFTGAKEGTVSGPRMVLRLGGSHEPWGWLVQASTLAVIFMFLNLLPGPGLSGGFLLLLAIEAVTGRQLTPPREHRVLSIVLLVVIASLTVATVVQDF